MPNIVEWDSEEDGHRRHRRKASTVHGWVTKMRGTLLGSENTRRQGLYEMKEARAIRRHKQEHPEAYRTRNRSNGGTILWIFPRRSRRRPEREHDHGHRSHSHGHAHSNSHSHGHSHSHGGHAHSNSRSHSRRRRHHDEPRYDDRYRERHSRRHPFLHFHHRVRPHHHGVGTFIMGCLLGKRDMRDKGRYLMRLAHKERRRERQMRRRERRDEAYAMKMDRTSNGHTWWHR
ncbi:uncharacterized protein TRAVEDRAFT_18191 [Trametes versicolor FP-101664 SS1]|uniref:uncharacterized protein n=1 Tax=Trametes versicolor (strain FP-101664) TaxID=717944 RepID=UPI00046224D7|nr:uncharacterized protein TRAVEDRAFT_18191 [Trametes versicolor FP-101664 SS1]EIW61496.1 hypothetical protein TRAVEDRAFT_18191 [Trametes versicolor FP-101664 SS1]